MPGQFVTVTVLEIARRYVHHKGGAMQTILDDFTATMPVMYGDTMVAQFEQRIELVLRPAPKWIPAKLWHRIAARFVIMKLHPLKNTVGAGDVPGKMSYTQRGSEQDG